MNEFKIFKITFTCVIIGIILMIINMFLISFGVIPNLPIIWLVAFIPLFIALITTLIAIFKLF